jgi:hypothetical protein
MTAKELLREWVESMSEEEAALQLPLVAESRRRRHLTTDDLTQVRAALKSLADGRKVSDSEMKRRFALS